MRGDALYRESASQQWRAVKIVRTTRSGEIVVQETNRLWPGVAVATLDQIRIPGRTFNLRHGGREL